MIFYNRISIDTTLNTSKPILTECPLFLAMCIALSNRLLFLFFENYIGNDLFVDLRKTNSYEVFLFIQHTAALQQVAVVAEPHVSLKCYNNKKTAYRVYLQYYFIQ